MTPSSSGAATGHLLGALQTEVDRRLAAADEALARDYPGDPVDRQPVHTVYVPGDVFGRETPREWGERALTLLAEHLPDAAAAAAVTGMDPALADEVYPRVLDTLSTQPVEDLRVDVEDGYGRRPDAVEDEHVASAVTALREFGTADGDPRGSASGSSAWRRHTGTAVCAPCWRSSTG